MQLNIKKHLLNLANKIRFQAIQNQMKAQGQEPINFDDFSNEVYDMVRPSVPRRIYIEDLISR